MELRWYSGAFVFIPLWIAFGVYFGHSFLDRAGAVGIWFYWMGYILVAGIFLAVWAKLVPCVVSCILGGVVWAVSLWFAFTHKLFL